MRVCTLARMTDVLRVVLSDMLLLFSVDCEGMHTCQNGLCIDSIFFLCYFQWIVRVCTLVRMADVSTVI